MVYAYPGQYSWDPLYIEIHETPQQSFDKQEAQRQQQRFFEEQGRLEQGQGRFEQQKSENQTKSNNLIEQYGATIYNECYDKYCANGDMANPTTQAMCLNSLEYNCLRREKSMEELRKKSSMVEVDSDKRYYDV